jgi:ectoine hydroxylase-related dioxygenase (phytanoyl-CoA dioxygenase family)
MSGTLQLHISEEQKRSFREEGFMILERAMSDEQLRLVRDECDFLLDLSCGNNAAERQKNHFISNRFKECKRLDEFIFSELMAEICRTTLGPDAFLVYEQMVVKAADKGRKFGWHQDSGYAHVPHRPYLTCWCALEDMSVANGTVYILPFSRAGTRELQPHVREEDGHDLIGYTGSDPGEPVIVPAGSIAVFSSVTFHRSGFNTTNKPRRVYVVQYSTEIMESPDKAVSQNRVPFLRNGQIVYRR